jgi:hypothetical protein
MKINFLFTQVSSKTMQPKLVPTLARAIIPVALCLALTASPVAAQQVWFAPPDNLDRGARTFNHDFPQLFESPATWDGKTDVFVLSPKFAEEAPEEEQERVTSWLAARHIALAVGAGTVQTDNAQRVDGECGYGVEGYSRPNKNQIIFSRLTRRGLDVQYVAMDASLPAFRRGPIVRSALGTCSNIATGSSIPRQILCTSIILKDLQLMR